MAWVKKFKDYQYCAHRRDNALSFADASTCHVSGCFPSPLESFLVARAIQRQLLQNGTKGKGEGPLTLHIDVHEKLSALFPPLNLTEVCDVMLLNRL